MGLAASQARFLGLTARKSNVEYQGQQINQQRTALSNEISGLFNEYSNLDVPVPPAVRDFQKTTYTLDGTSEKYQISNFQKVITGEYEGFYDVTLTCNEGIPKAYTNTFKNTVVKRELQGDEITSLSFQIGTDSYTYNTNASGEATEDSTITKITGDYNKYVGLSTIAGGNPTGTYYMFVRNGVNYYTSENVFTWY